MMRQRRGESGSVVTEATIVLPVFLIAMLFLINLINIFSLHNRIQFAMNSVAHEIASYAYISSALKLHQTAEDISKDGDEYTGRIDQTAQDILDCFDSLKTVKDDANSLRSQVANPDYSFQGVEQAVDQGKQFVDDIKDASEKTGNVIEDGKDIVSHPKETAIGVGYIGYDALLYGVRSGLGTTIVQGLMKTRLSDEYLKSAGVREGLDYSLSSLFNDDEARMVDVIVTYDVDLSLFGLVFEENNPKVSIVQRVTVPAWLDGDGQDLPEK